MSFTNNNDYVTVCINIKKNNFTKSILKLINNNIDFQPLNLSYDEDFLIENKNNYFKCIIESVLNNELTMINIFNYKLEHKFYIGLTNYYSDNEIYNKDPDTLEYKNYYYLKEKYIILYKQFAYDNDDYIERINELSDVEINIRFENNNIEDDNKIKDSISWKKLKKEKIPISVKNTLWSLFFKNNIQGNCQCCKFEIISKNNFDCGHIISEKNGGKIEFDNLKPICRSCNSSMSTTNMNDFMIKYGFDKINNI
jgi:hypothetical protein